MPESPPDIWIPDRYRDVTKAPRGRLAPSQASAVPMPSGVGMRPMPKEAPQPRSFMRTPYLYGSPLATGAVYEGSPRISHYELVELWRTMPWVRSAIRRIALICIREPLEIVEDRAVLDKDKKPNPDHKVYLEQFFQPDLSGEIVNIRQWQQIQQKLFLTFVRLKLFNQCWWEIVKNGFGDEVDFAVMPGRVVANVDSRGYFLDPNRAYTQFFEGKAADFAVDDVLHFAVPDIEGRQAASDLESIRVAAATDLFAQAYNKNSFRNNRAPLGVWTLPDTLEGPEFARAEARIESMYAGVENAGRAAIVAKDGVTFTPMVNAAAGNRDQEFLKGRNFSRDEMLSVLGASAGVMGMVQDVNRANLEGLIELVYKTESEPLVGIVQETLNLWRRWRKGIEGWRIQFKPPDFSQEADEVKVGVMAVGNGLETPNEWRVAHGKQPYDGGDHFFVPGTATPLGMSATPLYVPPANGEEARAEPVPEPPAAPAPTPPQGAPQGGTPGEPHSRQASAAGNASGSRAEATAPSRAAAKKSLYQPLYDELRRWKRKAMADRESGKVRKFVSFVLPPTLRDEVTKALDHLDTAAEVRFYFDRVMEDLQKAGVDGARATAAERQITEEFELAIA